MNNFFKKYLKQIGFIKTIYVFGDSHTEVFNYINNNRLLPYMKFHVLKVGGATAQGLRNPNSLTNALNIFELNINKLKKQSTLLFLLGEVDTGFVIWYRAKKYNESVNKQLNDSINCYKEFILKQINKGFKNIFVVAAPLPTIVDNQDWGDIANLRREIVIPQIERTKLTLEYNNLLKSFCQEMGLKFFNTDDFLLDSKNGVIYKKYLNENRNEHHLNNDEYSTVIIELFKGDNNKIND